MNSLAFRKVGRVVKVGSDPFEMEQKLSNAGWILYCRF